MTTIGLVRPFRRHPGQAKRDPGSGSLNLSETGVPTAWVYILASRPLETIYTGVTTDLPRRIYEHREGLVEGFSNRYGTNTLVWYEQHEDIGTAIVREKQIKRWRRQWKYELIEKMNPDWQDLYLVLNQ